MFNIYLCIIDYIFTTIEIIGSFSTLVTRHPKSLVNCLSSKYGDKISIKSNVIKREIWTNYVDETMYEKCNQLTFTILQ